MRLMRFTLCVLLAASAFSQELPGLYHDEWHGDPPYLRQNGWRSLLSGRDLGGWHGVAGQANDWLTTAAVGWKRIFSPLRLTAKAGPGDRIVNGPAGRTTNLVSDEKFGDFELHLEFMTARGSNSGVYLHGLYEIQIFDSQGYDGPLQVGDCGGIYEMDGARGGAAPLRNACRPPGEWQSLQVWFQAPRFDASGRKTANARILRVLLNEALVQREYELTGPTVSHLPLPEAPANPIMLQGDHGPIAFRNIYVRSRADGR
jgi:hypothetical protein